MATPTGQEVSEMLNVLPRGNKRAFSERSNVSQGLGESLHKVTKFNSASVEALSQQAGLAAAQLFQSPDALLKTTTEFQSTPIVAISQHLISHDYGLSMGDIVFLPTGLQLPANTPSVMMRIGGRATMIDNNALPGLNMQAVNLYIAQAQYKLLRDKNRDCKHNIFHDDVLGSVHQWVQMYTPVGIIGSENDAQGGDSFDASVRRKPNPFESNLLFDTRALRIKNAGIFTKGMLRMPNYPGLQRIHAGTRFWLVCKPTTVLCAQEFVTGRPGPPPQSLKVTTTQALDPLTSSPTDRVVLYQWSVVATSGVMVLPAAAFEYEANVEIIKGKFEKYTGYASAASVSVAIVRVNLAHQGQVVDKERLAYDYIYMRNTDPHEIGSVEVVADFGHVRYF